MSKKIIIILIAIIISVINVSCAKENINYNNTEIKRITFPIIIKTESEEKTNLEKEIVSDIYIPLVQDLTLKAISDEELDNDSHYNSFYENSVFIGDSITVGFADYYKNNKDIISVNNIHFLAKEGCSAYIVTSDVALTQFVNYMPIYQDQIQYIEDSISQMPNIEKAFICFGINDLVSSSPEKYIKDMKKIINQILIKNPELQIYIISIPCIAQDVITGSLSNDSIQIANNLLYKTCKEQQWGFINLIDYLMDQNGSLRSDYCSDNYVHQNYNAYQIWIKVLRNYAKNSS